MGFAGLENGKWFKGNHPAWVQKDKPPGATSLTSWHGQSGWWVDMISTKAFFYSPNFVWFAISLAMYILFPYDLESASEFSFSWIFPRILLNVTVTLLYVGFWFASLFYFRWSNRKFKPDNFPGVQTVIHNIWYTFLGAIQWSFWEVAFIHFWATGKLSYISDADAFVSRWNIFRMVAYTIAIPIWREFHFYWAHRLLHFRVLYKYVHSLHHRNVDVEPFSGLCMHPVEHLYYFATVAPSLFFCMSPFHLLWNGMHAVISPAAGHSGWEDHWQSDQFHYLHHARFECNYGGGGIPIDMMFGTLRDTLNDGGESKTYKGVSKGNETLKEALVFKKVSELSVKDFFPKLEDSQYFMACIMILILLTDSIADRGFGAKLNNLHSLLIPFVVSVGPIISGCALRLVHGDKFNILWPFHNESNAILCVHMFIGTMFTVFPVGYGVWLLLQ